MLENNETMKILKKKKVIFEILKYMKQSKLHIKKDITYDNFKMQVKKVIWYILQCSLFAELKNILIVCW